MLRADDSLSHIIGRNTVVNVDVGIFGTESVQWHEAMMISASFDCMHYVLSTVQNRI